MKLVLLALLFTACTEHGNTPDVDAGVDATLDAPHFPSCASVGCPSDSDLVDPSCRITGALCHCMSPFTPTPIACSPSAP